MSPSNRYRGGALLNQVPCGTICCLLPSVCLRSFTEAPATIREALSHCGTLPHTVHRLDCDTSGAMVLAKVAGKPTLRFVLN